jgi:hypothetical protein
VAQARQHSLCEQPDGVFTKDSHRQPWRNRLPHHPDARKMGIKTVAVYSISRQIRAPRGIWPMVVRISSPPSRDQLPAGRQDRWRPANKLQGMSRSSVRAMVFSAENAGLWRVWKKRPGIHPAERIDCRHGRQDQIEKNSLVLLK